MKRNEADVDEAPPRDEERYLVQPVIKAMQVLHLVCDAEEPISLNELARTAAMPKTTVFRYLRSLATKRLVEHDEATDRYKPGIGLWWLSHLSNPYEMLRQLCRPYIVQLRDEFNETVNLGVLVGSEVLYLDMIESRRSLRMQARIGSMDPLHSTALGKVLLAFRPKSQIENILPKKLVPVTSNTIVNRAGFLAQLDVVRENGYALDQGEDEEGSCCIAAPICDDRRGAIAAISLSGPENRMKASTREAMRAQLVRTCADIGKKLAADG